MQKPLNVGMIRVKPGIPRTGPNHQAASPEPVMQQMHHGAQHDHIPEPAKCKNEGLQGPGRYHIQPKRHWGGNCAADGAGQIESLILRGH